MNNRKSGVLCFVLIAFLIRRDAFADKEDKSDEIEDQEYKIQWEGNSSYEASDGPLDSHEAMNNRELSKSNREKRSYEFLMGLVNNNSKFEVTNVDSSTSHTKNEKEQIVANEALLELMVKIAADPVQWDKVHKLLQKIDNDLRTSKLLLENLPKSEKAELVLQKKEQFERTSEATTIKSKPAEDVKKMVVVLNGNKRGKSRSEGALKSNKWPEFEPEGRIIYKPPSELEHQSFETSKYPWQSETKPGSKTYPRNFAYHRVTGHPLYHTNIDKNPKAYIAVSVIAPKPLHSRPQDEDLILENELRQLKPWTHKQNLKNMAAIRSRWVIESENNKEPVAP